MLTVMSTVLRKKRRHWTRFIHRSLFLYSLSVVIKPFEASRCDSIHTHALYTLWLVYNKLRTRRSRENFKRYKYSVCRPCTRIEFASQTSITLTIFVKCSNLVFRKNPNLPSSISYPNSWNMWTRLKYSSVKTSLVQGPTSIGPKIGKEKHMFNFTR